MRTSTLLTALVTLASTATFAHDTTSTTPAPVWTTLHQVTFDALQTPGSFEARQFVLDLGPGAPNPAHVHGGNKLILVLDGELTLSPNGVKRVLKAGQSYLMLAGEVCTIANESQGNARFVMTILLPDGAPMTTRLLGQSKKNVQ